MNIPLDYGLNEYFIGVDNYKYYIKLKHIRESDELIIFIHGLACSSDSFRNVFDTDYFPSRSVLLVDLIGFGKSGKPDQFSYSMEDQAELLGRLISLFPCNKIHIAAHSMGGAIGLLLSGDILDRISSFANIEGNLIGDDCGIFSRGVIAVPFEEYRSDQFIRQSIENTNHPQLRFDETTPFAVYKSSQSLVDWSDSGKLLQKFKSIQCRKSYFYGEENKNMTVLGRLDFAEKFMISRSGHGLMTDNPPEFYRKLAAFISHG